MYRVDPAPQQMPLHATIEDAVRIETRLQNPLIEEAIRRNKVVAVVMALHFRDNLI
jgi:hypothetical protein